MFAPRIMTLAAAGVLAAAACADAAGPGGAVAHLRLGAGQPRVEAGQTLQLTAIALDAFDRPVAGAGIAWRSDAPEISTVDATGKVTGISPGTARITAWAGKAFATVPLVVEPRGGLGVARFGLLPPERGQRFEVDSWPLSRQGLRFLATNPEGVSLCGLVPLTVQVRDSAMLAATYDPAGGCWIGLTVNDGPDDVDSTMLVVGTGGYLDSLRVYVHRIRMRLAFSADRTTVAAGDSVHYSLLLLGPDGRGLTRAWIPATQIMSESCCQPFGTHFEVTLGANGTAEFSLPAPTSTLAESGEGHPHPHYYHAMAGVIGDVLLDGKWLGYFFAPVNVVPGPATRIAVFEPAWQLLPQWREVAGDTARGRAPGATCGRSWIAAAAVDRFGNPVSTTPTLSGDPVGLYESSFVTGYSEGLYGLITHYYANGRRVVFGRDTAGTTRVTLSYPGLPSRTVTSVLARC
ncbi:MAG TPA: Ig-like domain-containing protein [Longimicrobium sp.]|nr:Ig-like domain-containing protein [Longimicrobium sp.]